MSGGLHILIVEDHALLRARLADRVVAQLEAPIIGMAVTMSDALLRAAEAPWDVVLLDVHLPDGNSLESFPLLRAKLPEAAIIVMTTFPESEQQAAALRLGAAAFVSKTDACTRLAAIVDKSLQIREAPPSHR